MLPTDWPYPKSYVPWPILTGTGKWGQCLLCSEAATEWLVCSMCSNTCWVDVIFFKISPNDSHCFHIKIQRGWHVRLLVTVLLPTCLISSYLALQSSLHAGAAPVILNEPLVGHGIFHELSLLSVFIPSLPGTFSPNNSLDPTQSFFLPPLSQCQISIRVWRFFLLSLTSAPSFFTGIFPSKPLCF